MKYNTFKYICFIYLLAGISACVPTDTGMHNPNEKIYCDIITQLNGNDESVKSEVRFYVKDEESRPYFIEGDVMVDGKVMEKKFIDHKGIYYSSLHKMENSKGLKISFTNLDDVKYDIEVPLSLVEMDLGEKATTMKDLQNEELNEGESILLIDTKGKIFDIKKSKVINEASLGKVQMMKTVVVDSSYQLKNKLWVKYNAKSLSATQLMDIVE